MAFTACKGTPEPEVEAIAVWAYANPTALIEVGELAENMGRTDLKLVDFRKKPAFEAGHIPGAVQLWRPDIEDHEGAVPGLMAGKEALEALLSSLGIAETDTLIIYDDEAGCNAARLWWVLQAHGYDRIRLLNGGVQAWTEAGQDMTTELPTPVPATFRFPETGNPGSGIQASELLARLGEPDLVILDTRTPEEYSGLRQKSGAVRAGHIPGSLNRDWAGATHYNQDKRFKSPEDLYKRYGFLMENDSADVVAYCHSGVRSAHTYFVLTQLLGHNRVRNFDGSWLEWSMREDAPIQQDSLTQIFN